MIKKLTTGAIDLLKTLISTPSFSSEEQITASHIENWMREHDIKFNRLQNNIYAVNKYFDKSKPTLLLNSHHDTVRPNKAYTRDPFEPSIDDGKLYGLGSNDAGGSLVSMITIFTYFYERSDLSHNLIIVASGEEESSGLNGLNSVLPKLPKIDLAIIGEPTQMHLAIAEKGLIVFDAEVCGIPSHAAHANNNNAIYNTIEVLEWFKNFKFEKISETLGEVKVTVTQISGGVEHNVVPARVSLVADVRVNDCYTNQDIVDILNKTAPCKLTPRSLRLGPSHIDLEHPMVKVGMDLGRKTYGSPTLSDQAVLSCPSLKLGPGDSFRSHSADEYIYIKEIEEALSIYKSLLEKFLVVAK